MTQGPLLGDGTSKGVKRKPLNAAVPEPKRSKKAIIPIGSDSELEKPSFAYDRVRTNQEAPAKLAPPQPKEPPTLPWVDKYTPSKPEELVGQLTEKSPHNKLIAWLRNWHKHNLGGAAHEKKVKPAPFAKNDDGRACKAALLSGPPGVGKTTPAAMACKELGITYTELNASDVRNKESIEQTVGESLESRGLDMWMMQKKSEPTEVNHVLIMDEVDGTSGNQDRAGIAELILMIKRSKIPIICICNDRQSQKIRSLANHCFDLRFNRPQVAQIKEQLNTIIEGETLKVPKELVDKIIEASNQDIRQCIYSLQLVAAGRSNKEELYKKDVSLDLREVVALYNEYDLSRDDTEAIDELGVWPQCPDIAKSINSKTKAAVTRTLNKESRMLRYALEEPIKGRLKAETAGGGQLQLDEEGHVVEKVIGDDDELIPDAEDEPSSVVDMVAKEGAGAGGNSSTATGGTQGGGRGG
ncbi:CBN-RFC-1 protein [Aphelenchoides avenae]|nr:CBN-RFC-1 protein [Aphelenchus avenae]